MKTINYLQKITFNRKYFYNTMITKEFSKNIYTNTERTQNKFELDKEFLKVYENKTVNFGFNGLGELVYRRTYSRVKDNGFNEQWWETVKRVTEGAFNLLYRHLNHDCIKITKDIENQIQCESKLMYEKIFTFKFLPPGRGLWSMGTNITENKRIYAALNNCAFVSTLPQNKNNIDDIIKPYIFLMDCAMLGVGVGFDTKASTMGIKIFCPNSHERNTYVIPDSREGWVESVGKLLKSYFIQNSATVLFDYSLIRPAGSQLKTFGGISAGFKPLKELHDNLSYLLSKNSGLELDSRIIVDIMNFIGKSVIAGNISILI